MLACLLFVDAAFLTAGQTLFAGASFIDIVAPTSRTVAAGSAEDDDTCNLPGTVQVSRAAAPNVETKQWQTKPIRRRWVNIVG